MNTSELLASIESEIDILQQVRNLLSAHGRYTDHAVKRPAKTHHTMSAEARARIAAAQKRRWAKFRAKKRAA